MSVTTALAVTYSTSCDKYGDIVFSYTDTAGSITLLSINAGDQLKARTTFNGNNVTNVIRAAVEVYTESNFSAPHYTEYNTAAVSKGGYVEASDSRNMILAKNTTMRYACVGTRWGTSNPSTISSYNMADRCTRLIKQNN